MRRPAEGSRDEPGAWRREPFRLLFPIGVLVGWLGVGPWLLYSLGLSSTYSCFRHGLIQTEAFLMAFATGFLWTALPRRTRAPFASPAEIGTALGALALTTGALLEQHWTLGQTGYLALFAVLLAFALRRFLAGAARRRPPAAFVLLPIALAQGVLGASLLIAFFAAEAAPWTVRLGRLLIEQGVFLCLVMGVGALILPLMAGAEPPADLGSSPAETRRALLFATAGAVVFASLVAEALGSERVAPLLRALTVALVLALGGGIARSPGRPGLHRRLVWLAAWCVPAGIAGAAVAPDLRVASLHILFIGGFSLLAFGVGTHVALAHLGRREELEGRPGAVIFLAASLALALAARLTADLGGAYFAHIGAAAACWIVGTAAWLVFLLSRLLSAAARGH